MSITVKKWDGTTDVVFTRIGDDKKSQVHQAHALSTSSRRVTLVTSQDNPAITSAAHQRVTVKGKDDQLVEVNGVMKMMPLSVSVLITVPKGMASANVKDLYAEVDGAIRQAIDNLINGGLLE